MKNFVYFAAVLAIAFLVATQFGLNILFLGIAICFVGECIVFDAGGVLESAEKYETRLKYSRTMLVCHVGWYVCTLLLAAFFDVLDGYTYYVEDAIGNAIQTVFDFDSVLIELTKVTDLSGDELKQFSQDAFDVATQISSTGQAVLEASVIFAQAGYEANEALNLAKWATVLTNVSEAGATAEESASTLIATMKAFGMESKDAGHIVDVLNEVDVFASRYSNVA